MRVFLAGASGVIGRALIPLLVGSGHEVAGMTRTAAKSMDLTALGAIPVVCDVYDAERLARAVTDFDPDLVLHQLTDLPDELDRIGEFATRNSRIRTGGTRNLLAAAQAAGTTRFFAQSIAWVPLGGEQVLAEHEGLVLSAGGVVLRYGAFYGPGTYFEGESLPAPPRIEVSAAAQRTLDVLGSPSGIITIAEEGAAYRGARGSTVSRRPSGTTDGTVSAGPMG